jgi:3-hydroxyacyl-CoA dehydrogenase
MQFAVIGSGSIGIGWAIVFARAGNEVKVYDIDQSRLDYFTRGLNERLGFLMEEALLDEDATIISARVTTTLDLADAVRAADYIQECAPELLETKKVLFASLIKLSTPEAIIASSTSALKSSSFTSNLATRERCLVVHPGNPPYLLSVVEVVPAPYTSVDVVARTQEILRELQLNPILVKKEIEGFVFNRLQGAMLREAYSLVKDGVIEPKDIDMVVTQGLAKRWSIIGPFGTSALNVEGGIKAHAARMGESYYRMGVERGQGERWSDELVAIVAQSIEKIFHNEDWVKNVNKRDRALMKLTRLMRESDGFNFYR